MESVEFQGDASGPDAPEEQQPQGERPEGLPEKFNSVVDLAQSYQELEQKLGVSSDDNDEAGEPAESTEELSEQVSDTIGADTFEKYSSEYFENNGQLSEESYKELQENHNFSPELVDSFIRGQEAVAQNDTNEIQSVIGGAENYKNLMEWSQENLSEAEQDSYNNTVKNGDIPSVKMALQGLYSRFATENGIDPGLVQGTSKGRAAGYESKSQMIADMSKPEYQTDPAFRDTVEKRLASTPAGII